MFAFAGGTGVTTIILILKNYLMLKCKCGKELGIYNKSGLCSLCRRGTKGNYGRRWYCEWAKDNNPEAFLRVPTCRIKETF